MKSTLRNALVCVSIGILVPVVTSGCSSETMSDGEEESEDVEQAESELSFDFSCACSYIRPVTGCPRYTTVGPGISYISRRGIFPLTRALAGARKEACADYRANVSGLPTSCRVGAAPNVSTCVCAPWVRRGNGTGYYDMSRMTTHAGPTC